MPCDTITTQTISAALSKAMPELLLVALKDEGWIQMGIIDGTLAATNGRDKLTWAAGVGLRIMSASTEQGEAAIRSLTVAYSKAAVSWAAKRAGWQVKSTGANTMKLTRL